MDSQSAGAILQILNLIALADGFLSPKEEDLLDSLIKQHQLQAKTISWQDKLENPTAIAGVAALVSEDLRPLAMKTACMVAGVSRLNNVDQFICIEEDALLNALAASFQLSSGDQEALRAEAIQQLERNPSLWQVLFSCFGNQFEWPKGGPSR